jgi:ASC-1-like (ASCH) protein
MSTHEINVSEPWFTLIRPGLKKVEGRLNKGKFSKINPGDTIIFTNNVIGPDVKFEKEIKNITYYDNFQTYLENETLEKCLPGINTIEDGLKIYYNFYTKNDELEYKIIAFTF